MNAIKEDITIGNIRMIRGDCLNVLPELIKEGIKVDACICDVPYGILKGHKIETNIPIPEYTKLHFDILKDDGFYSFFGQMPTLLNWCNETAKHFKYSDHIVWAKKQQTAIALPLTRTHESFLIYKKGNPKYFNRKGKYEDVNNPKVALNINSFRSINRYIADLRMKADGKNIPLKRGGSKDDYYDYMCGTEGDRSPEKVNFSNLWAFFPENCSNKNKDIIHPTVKSVAFLERAVELLTTPDGIVLDSVMGSGTTAVSCVNTNRKCIGIEIDEAYYRLAVKRVDENSRQQKFDF